MRQGRRTRSDSREARGRGVRQHRIDGASAYYGRLLRDGRPGGPTFAESVQDFKAYLNAVVCI